MALARLQNDDVYRWRIAFPQQFADWTAPTSAELNDNDDNSDPNALIFNPTCALNTGGSQFDLDDPTLDESLTFCQVSGDSEVISRSATVALQYEMSKLRWDDATSTDAADGYNTANLVHSLLAWRGIDYFIILSVGKDVDQPFAAGDRIKMVEVSTDYAVPEIATGSNILWTQTPAKRTRINWNYELAS